MAQSVKVKRTLVRFAVQKTRHVAGKGAATSWETIKSQIGTTDDGEPIMTDRFYVEWLSSYGAAAIQQQSDGVIQPARVRMPYVKAVYDALTTKDVRIYLHGVTDDAHAFRLASSADNYLQQNKMLEFQVKKYEVK